MSKRGEMDRRSFLGRLVGAASSTAVGGIVWGGLVTESGKAPLALRPPGALPEDDFMAKCIRCGMCLEACPYDTLVLAKPGSGVPNGTPHFTPRDVPCYLCQDVPCAVECPTDALDTGLLTAEDGQTLDVNRARMGLAVIDYDNCIAAWGLRCEACYRACPLIDEAITLEVTRNDRTNRHAVMLPRVQAEACTGCGVCEQACIVSKAAIFVLPHEVAQGEVGENYIRGWDAEDQDRLQGEKDPAAGLEDNSDSALDYLNEGGFGDD